MNSIKTLNTLSTTTRLAAFAMALVTSAVVLGSTVAGMQPAADDGLQVVALERVTVTAPRIN